MTDNIVLKIIKSRFKKPKKDKEIERLREICKGCNYNTKNLNHISLDKKIIIFFSDLYSYITGNKEEDNLSNCSICGCSIYYKTQEYQFEECPKGYWYNKNK